MMTSEEIGPDEYYLIYQDFMARYQNNAIGKRFKRNKKMRGADTLSQYEDEFLTGGPCPSCRLAIDKETGRLKWCTGRNDTWRFRVKLMLLIPAVLLPITIIFIALSRSQVISKAPYQRAYLANANHAQNQRAEQNDADFFPPTSHSMMERSDEMENGEKFLPGMKTSYVPEETLDPVRTFKRRKRDVDQVPLPERDSTLDDYYPASGSTEEKRDHEIRSGEETEYEDVWEAGSEEIWDRIPFHKLNPMIEDGKRSGKSDIRLFWKDKRDERRIREAQAKIMLGYMDRTIHPCDDFYQYACGNWKRRNPIPKDKAAYDTFEMIRESLDTVLRDLLEEPISTPEPFNTDDAIVKAKNLFRSCTNYEILDQRMAQPLLDILDELGGWPMLKSNWDPEKFDWLLLIAQIRKYNNDIFISEWVAVDIKNSDQYVIQFDQATLGLPTRDYFLQPWNRIYLLEYRNYLITVATILGASLSKATADAVEIIDFETKLAKITATPDQRRSVSEVYQRMTLGELRSLVPQINWQRYLAIVLGKPANISEPVVVFALRYIQDLVNLLSRTPSRTIANYLLWRFVQRRVNNLDDRFQEAKQKFYRVLFGREAVPARWKNCVEQVNANMGMAVGSMFIRKYFDEESKSDTLEMTRNIQRAFKELLQNTTWIYNSTRELASEKVDAMLLTIGYPDFILEPDLLNDRYKDVVIHPDKYFENTLNILQHLTKSEHARLGKPVDKKALWLTGPANVNAYYGRSKNRIMFPAGILQPPFYHRHFPRSLNYGGIGTVIGHEITHGFDDEGRLFDKDGNLHKWWTIEEMIMFHYRAQCLTDQYSHYVVKEVGLQVNGNNTQGENIADNGGVKQAFRAYEGWKRMHSETDETLPGLNATGEQLFFLNFAQLWCGSMRPEAMLNKLMTAVHSPGRYRVIGTLSNSEEFAKVYNCPRGTPMNPVKKCSVW